MLTVTASTIKAKAPQSEEVLPGELPYLELARYLSGVIGSELTIGADQIRLLRKQHKPKSGILYRGLRLESSTAIKMLANKRITLKRKRFPLISWTSLKGIAVGFASMMYRPNMIGAVLRVNIPMKDRVLALNDRNLIDKVIEIAGKHKWAASSDYKHIRDIYSPIRLEDTMQKEAETLAEYNINRRYNMCANISDIIVRGEILNKPELSLALSIINKIDEPSKEELGLDDPDMYVDAMYVRFKCNNKGALSLHSSGSSKDIGVE